MASPVSSVSTELMALYLLGLPAMGAVIALLAAMSSLRRAKENMPYPARLGEAKMRVSVLLTVVATPLVFGFVSFMTYNRLDGFRVPAGLAIPAAQAFGIPAFLLGIGYAILFDKGVKAAVLKPETFIRTLVMAANLELVIVLALILTFTMFGYFGHPPPLGFVDMAQRSSLYMMAGSLAAPAGALVARRMWDFESIDKWLRALVYQVLAVGYVVIFFALSMLSLTGAI